ncbi:UNVERIFIED_CONTAM: hypothetical protein HDU68_009419 [Siphonaria sp. JEL0065]|nr:hypothetical protein HDU68_009419 [Siphonaria sp. JEL0065]
MTHEYIPVTLHMAFVSIFGTDARRFTRGLTFDTNSDFLQCRSASKSISIISKIAYDTLIDIFEAFSPKLIIEQYGLKAIAGVKITQSYLSPTVQRDFEENIYKNYSKWLERSSVVPGSVLYQEARAMASGMANSIEVDSDTELVPAENDNDVDSDSLASIQSDSD